ncbi:hypothetical protein ACOME3_007434 [Neoechinorhynchus agilis]
MNRQCKQSVKRIIKKSVLLQSKKSELVAAFREPSEKELKKQNKHAKEVLLEQTLEYQKLINPDYSVRGAVLDKEKWTGEAVKEKDFVPDPLVDIRARPFLCSQYFSIDGMGEIIRHDIPMCAGGIGSEEKRKKIVEQYDNLLKE